MKYAFGIRFGSYILYELTKPLCFNCLETSNVRLVRNLDNFDYRVLGIQYSSMTELLQKKIDLFVYFDGEKPLGMMCGFHGSCYIRGPGISIIQDKNFVYWFWIYTLPESRGKNVYKTLKTAFFAHYNAATGFTALVEPSNNIMNLEMTKLRFVESKRYYYIKYKNKSLVLERSNYSARFNHCYNAFNLIEI